MAKNKAWGDILKKVNAVTTCPRELHEVKKKWSDMKTEVRRKVAQARAAIEGTSADSAAVPVILSAMQQRICNLLGEATIISLPAGDPDAELSLPVTVNATVSLAESKSTGHRVRGQQQPADLSLTSQGLCVRDLCKVLQDQAFKDHHALGLQLCSHGCFSHLIMIIITVD